MASLDQWMTDNDRDDAWLAGELGCDRSQAWRIRKRKSRTSPARAFQIESLTNGEVSAAELLTAPIETGEVPTEQAA